MNYSYFPGCTLKTKGAQLDRAGTACGGKAWLFAVRDSGVAVLRRGVSAIKR